MRARPPSHESTKTLSVKGFRCEAFRRTSRIGPSTRCTTQSLSSGCLCFSVTKRRLNSLTAIQEHVKPGGRAIVNVLIEGTTYLGMFDPDNYCLFRRNELDERFDGWNILDSRYHTFPAPEDTRKDFSTIIAEKPS